MSFEQTYGRWLTQQLNLRVRKLNEKFHLALVCKQYTEVAQKPNFGGTDEVAVIIYGGNASRSQTEGVDYNTLPLMVLVICWEEHSPYIHAAVEDVQEAFNATQIDLGAQDILSGESIELHIKSVFTSPYIIDEVDYPTEHETKKACYLSFSATVSYGKTAIVMPPVAVLRVGETDYALAHLSAYDFSAQPSVDTALPKGTERARLTKLSRTHAYSFTVAKTDGDKLQEVFGRELKGLDGGLSGQKLCLTLDGDVIPIQTYDLTESYQNNAAAYTLNLTA